MLLYRRGNNLAYPPLVGDPPPVLVPEWTNLHGYIINGRLINADHHTSIRSSRAGTLGSARGGSSPANMV